MLTVQRRDPCLHPPSCQEAVAAGASCEASLPALGSCTGSEGRQQVGAPLGKAVKLTAVNQFIIVVNSGNKHLEHA